MILIKPRKLIITLIIMFGIISFWRGIWGLMDIFLFPNNEFLSYFSAFLLGFLILISFNKLSPAEL